MEWPVFIEREVADVLEASSEMLRRIPRQLWKLAQIESALLCLSGLQFGSSMIVSCRDGPGRGFLLTLNPDHEIVSLSLRRRS